MPGQIDQDRFTLLGEVVWYRYQATAAVTDAVHEHQRRAGSESFKRQHGGSSSGFAGR